MAFVPPNTPPTIGWAPRQPVVGTSFMEALAFATDGVGDPALAVLENEVDQSWIILGVEVYAHISPASPGSHLYVWRFLFNPVSFEVLWEAFESQGYSEVDREALF